MSFELQGTMIVKNDTQVISDRFKKREFVIEKKETSPNGYEFVDTIKFQLTQDKCDVLDNIQLGQNVNVSFNVKGNKWEKNGQVSYFVNLDAWKVEPAEAAQGGAQDQSAPPPPAEIPPAADEDSNDDLPF